MSPVFLYFYNFSHQSPMLDDVIYFTADILPYVAIVLAFLFLIFHHHIVPSQNPFGEFIKKWKEIFIVFFSGTLAWVIAEILKLIVRTERPFRALSEVEALFPKEGYAFPSGHATFFAALAVSIFLIHRKAGTFFMVIALLIGLARVAAGVHFPIDILGGFVLGACVAYFLRSR